MRAGVQEFVELVAVDSFTGVNPKGRAKCFSNARLFKSEDTKLLCMVHGVEDETLIRKTEEAVHLSFKQQHFPKAFGSQIGVDSAGRNDAATSAISEQVKCLLNKELVEVGVRSDFLAVNETGLVLEVGRGPEICRLMWIARQIFDPRLTCGRVLQKLRLLAFEVLNGHIVLAAKIRILLEELLRVGLESFPRWVGDDDVESAALAVQNLVELVAPMEGTQ